MFIRNSDISDIFVSFHFIAKLLFEISDSFSKRIFSVIPSRYAIRCILLKARIFFFPSLVPCTAAYHARIHNVHNAHVANSYEKMSFYSIDFEIYRFECFHSRCKTTAVEVEAAKTSRYFGRFVKEKQLFLLLASKLKWEKKKNCERNVNIACIFMCADLYLNNAFRSLVIPILLDTSTCRTSPRKQGIISEKFFFQNFPETFCFPICSTVYYS